MGINLSASHVQQIRRAQDILLAALGYVDTEEWAIRANRAVATVLGADHSCFAWPDPSEGLRIATDDTGPEFATGLLASAALKEPRKRYEDAFLERVHRRRVRRGHRCYHLENITRREERASSVSYQDLFVPAGFGHLVALSAPTPRGEVTQFFGFERAEAPGYSEGGMARLRLLATSFAAGIRARAMLDGRRKALQRLLDEVAHPLLLYDAGGDLLHRNRAFEALLASDPSTGSLPEAADRLVTRLGRRHEAVRKAEERSALARPEATLEGYRLSASYLPARLAGPEVIVVMVEPPGPILPSVGETMRRFGLTRRQAQVARLMAHGLTDKAIARRLAVRHGTARKHAERVLRKLDLSSRAGIALRLLGPGPPPSPDPEGRAIRHGVD